jgi:hypothetical protein
MMRDYGSSAHLLMKRETAYGLGRGGAGRLLPSAADPGACGPAHHELDRRRAGGADQRRRRP